MCAPSRMVDLGAGNQRETIGPVHTALDRIGALEMLVDRPETHGVEMLRQRETVESDPSRHAHQAFDGDRVEREMLDMFG